MQHLALAAHLGRMGQLDICSGRRLVWFDSLESVNLASPGWVALLRKFQVDSSPALLDAKQVMLACPQCRSGLRTVHNRSRYGAFAALACPRGHGHLHTHTGALAYRGLARRLLPAERGALLRGHKPPQCLGLRSLRLSAGRESPAAVPRLRHGSGGAFAACHRSAA